jgi:hypothetical protein
MKFIGALLLLLLLPSSAAAQVPPDADLKEIQAYRLTGPVMKQVVTATRSMIGAVKQEGEAARLQATVANVIGKSLTDIERAIEKEPLVTNALKPAGISAREYAKFMVVFFQTSMLQNMLKSGAVKEAPATANPDNLRFVEANQAEVNALMAEFQSLNKKK